MATGVQRTFSLEPFDYGEARRLMDALGLAEPVAVTLVRRGHRTVADAQSFLSAEESHDPFAFADMRLVCDRVEAAISAGERITVHGDYDVDGVCSTAILVGALRGAGADCDWWIPGRSEDGYGLTAATVDRLAGRGTSLLVTVDCGIGSVDEVALAKQAGLDVIVTDHHQPGEQLPDCPILHPALGGYPFADLCATAVAHKLATAIRGAEATASDLDLVALATVADLVPLRGENRSLVRAGLAEARRGRRPGLRALMASARIVPERVHEADFGFKLGPRINAAGRLYRADAGVELMLTQDEERATSIAAELDRANHERREVERLVVEAAEESRRELPDDLGDAPGLVLAGAGWHAGVVGIVASRVVERHGKPAVLISIDDEGKARGSGRSVPGFDLLAALRACDEHLTRYGGHRAAAGLELEADRIDAFRRAFAAHCAATLGDEPRPRVEVVDAIVGGESLGHDVAEQLGQLGPFGNGNPGVRLLVPGAKLADIRPMGEEDRHARFTISSGGGRASGVAFGVNGSLATAAAGGPLDLSVELELNEWNGAVQPRVVLGDLYPLEPAAAEPPAPNQIPDGEFWARHEAELGAPLEWPPASAPHSGRREVVDRRRTSGTAAIAALASSGELVLGVCADAIRRRELIERVARPARFGGGEMAIVSSRLSDTESAAGEARVQMAGAGVVLADWAALARDPGLAGRFAHLVVIDPPPFAHLERVVEGGEGWLHRLDGPEAADFALRVHLDEWPSRSTLAAVFRALGSPTVGSVDLPSARRTLTGADRAHPHSPEVAARAARVLADLGLIAWEGSGAERRLRVVSSSGTDLERSEAYVAYRDREEEGRRYLSERRQT